MILYKSAFQCRRIILSKEHEIFGFGKCIMLNFIHLLTTFWFRSKDMEDVIVNESIARILMKPTGNKQM